ncbi:hypothetical protein LCGC14_2333600 [marine sediment metagenome]|uniref:Uncharacterized protein n=1 Tax=marine sediment metagenome TaxID=412755 RepID=A0A0F9D1K6_9ZZZZ
MPTETLRPDGDIAAGGWTTVPLFSKVNDQSDVASIGAGGLDPIDCLISFPTPSIATAGYITAFTLRVRARLDAGAPSLIAQLIHGDGAGGIVALLGDGLFMFSLTGSFVFYEEIESPFTFTEAQLANLEVDLDAVSGVPDTTVVSQVELVLTYSDVWTQDGEPAGSWTQDSEPAGSWVQD